MAQHLPCHLALILPLTCSTESEQEASSAPLSSSEFPTAPRIFDPADSFRPSPPATAEDRYQHGILKGIAQPSSPGLSGVDCQPGHAPLVPVEQLSPVLPTVASECLPASADVFECAGGLGVSKQFPVKAAARSGTCSMPGDDRAKSTVAAVKGTCRSVGDRRHVHNNESAELCVHSELDEQGTTPCTAGAMISRGPGCRQLSPCSEKEEATQMSGVQGPLLWRRNMAAEDEDCPLHGTGSSLHAGFGEPWGVARVWENEAALDPPVSSTSVTNSAGQKLLAGHFGTPAAWGSKLANSTPSNRSFDNPLADQSSTLWKQHNNQHLAAVQHQDWERELLCARAEISAARKMMAWFREGCGIYNVGQAPDNGLEALRWLAHLAGLPDAAGMEALGIKQEIAGDEMGRIIKAKPLALELAQLLKELVDQKRTNGCAHKPRDSRHPSC